MVPLFMVPAAIGVAGMLVYAVGLPDQQLHARPGRDWRGVQDAHLDDAAKDLGVFNVANVGPRWLAPFAGAALIGGAPKDYEMLCLAAAALTFLGALASLPVNKVRR
jgi:hypothetical protein